MPEVIDTRLTLSEQAVFFANMYALGELPDNPQYKASVYHREELSVHYKWKASPGSLIANLRPHEPESVQAYRHLNYEQNTFPVGFSVINALKGVLSNPQVFDIQYATQIPVLIGEGEDLQTYLTRNAAVPGKDLIKYFWNFISTQSLLDSNGYVVMINQKSDAQVEAIRQMGNPSDLSEWRSPLAFFVPSSFVMAEGQDYVFVRSTETEVITHKKKNYVVPIFWYFTEDITFQVRATGAREVKEGGKTTMVFDWDVVVWDEHNSGIAARKPQGIISDERVWEVNGDIHRHESVMEMDDVGFFLSILSLSVPDFNRAVKILSDLESGLVASLFPIKTVEMQMCNTCKGSGEIYDDHSDKPYDCHTCQGVGKIFPTGPFAGVAKNPNESGVINPAVVWSVPPTDSFDFAWRMYNEAILSGLKALSHGNLREALKGNSGDTARSKEIDQSQQHIIAREVGAIWYPLLQWMLDKANDLRYGKLLSTTDLEDNRAIVMMPSTLDITMLSDLFDQIEKMQAVSMPPEIKKIWATRAIDRDLGSGSPTALRANTILSIDPFAMMTEEEIMVAKARHSMSDEQTKKEFLLDVWIHDHIGNIVDILKAKESNFFKLPPVIQKQLAREEAESRIGNVKLDPEPVIEE